MPQFTKFGIWDDEVKELIKDISVATQLSTESLKEWLYDAGLVFFLKAQKIRLQQDTSVYLQAYKKRPAVSSKDIETSNRVGFELLWAKWPAQLNLDEIHQEAMFVVYAAFVEKAIQLHENFYALQAKIATSYNQFLDGIPFCNEAATRFEAEQFIEALPANQTIADDINAHLLLIDEYKSYLATSTTPIISVKPMKAISTGSMFSDGNNHPFFTGKRRDTPIDELKIGVSGLTPTRESNIVIFRKSI